MKRVLLKLSGEALERRRRIDEETVRVLHFRLKIVDLELNRNCHGWAILKQKL